MKGARFAVLSIAQQPKVTLFLQQGPAAEDGELLQHMPFAIPLIQTGETEELKFTLGQQGEFGVFTF